MYNNFSNEYEWIFHFRLVKKQHLNELVVRKYTHVYMRVDSILLFS